MTRVLEPHDQARPTTSAAAQDPAEPLVPRHRTLLHHAVLLSMLAVAMALPWALLTALPGPSEALVTGLARTGLVSDAALVFGAMVLALAAPAANLGALACFAAALLDLRARARDERAQLLRLDQRALVLFAAMLVGSVSAHLYSGLWLGLAVQRQWCSWSEGGCESPKRPCREHASVATWVGVRGAPGA